MVMLAAFAGRMAMRRSQRRAVPDWARWVGTARTLPLRDRFELYRATSQGRAVSRPELAELAQQRCRAATSMIEHNNVNLRSWWRVGLVIVVFICAVLTVVRAVVENHVSSLVQAVLYASLGFLMTPAVQRRSNERALVRLRQAADANAGALP
ncbi:MAG TPA: hypothetical protein VFR67_03770 [Pilimelia sp.]|nr:hypothetical protein [Pilimelia sp.]